MVERAAGAAGRICAQPSTARSCRSSYRLQRAAQLKGHARAVRAASSPLEIFGRPQTLLAPRAAPAQMQRGKRRDSSVQRRLQHASVCLQSASTLRRQARCQGARRGSRRRSLVAAPPASSCRRQRTLLACLIAAPATACHFSEGPAVPPHCPQGSSRPPRAPCASHNSSPAAAPSVCGRPARRSLAASAHRSRRGHRGHRGCTPLGETAAWRRGAHTTCAVAPRG